jgi:hypothetical protein
MTCPNCGQFAAPGDAFCARCGTPLNPTISPTPPPDHDLAVLGQGPSLPPDGDLALLGPESAEPDDELAILGPPAPVDDPDDEPVPSFAAAPSVGDAQWSDAQGSDAQWSDAQGSDSQWSDTQWSGAGESWSQPTGRPDGAELPPASSLRGEREPDTAKWVVAAIVAVLAITALSLAGLALVHRSRSTAGDGHSPSNSANQTTGFTSGSTTADPSSPAGTGTKPVRTVSVSSTASGTRYSVSVWAENTTTDCAGHAYGKPMTDFLKKTACTKMTRRLGTTTVAGKPVGFALTVIAFGSTKSAGAFATLVTKDGTGNLNDLLREGQALPSGPKSVPNPDAFSCRADGTRVVVVDAWYLSGKTPTNDPPLTKLARDFSTAAGVGTLG